MKKTFNLVKRLILFMKHLMPYILVAVMFAIMGFISVISISYILLESALNKNLSLNILWILVFLAIFRGLMRYGEHYFGHYVAFRSLKDMRSIVFDKLKKLSPNKLDNKDSGILIKMIGEDIEALEIFFAHTIAPTLTGTIAFILLFIYFYKVHYLLAFLSSVCFVLLAIIMPIFYSNKLLMLQKQNEVKKEYNSIFLDTLKGIKELIQFNYLSNKINEIDLKSKEVNLKEKEIAVSNYNQGITTYLIIGFMVSLYSYVALNLMKIDTHNNNYLLSIIVFVSSFAPFLELSRLPLGFKRAMNAADDIFKLLDEEYEVDNFNDFKEHILDIKASDLSFSYGSDEVFNNTNFNFKNNKIIGISAKSGSGKSTIMKIIMKWYKLNSGNIYFNDKNYDLYSKRSIQNKFVYIFQDSKIFKQSLRENITLKNNNITDEMILNIAAKFQMKERIVKEGLDSIVSADSFSAGERQRIELMRAALKEADFFIFDEPTSYLDSLNEATVLNLIKNNFKATIFLISHRPSTLSIADEIYEIVDKKIVLRR